MTVIPSSTFVQINFWKILNSTDLIHYPSATFSGSSGRQHSSSFLIYGRMHKRSKIVTRNLCMYVYVFIPISYIIPITYNSYSEYFKGAHSTDAFKLFYPIVWVYLVRTYLFLLFSSNYDFSLSLKYDSQATIRMEISAGLCPSISISVDILFQCVGNFRHLFGHLLGYLPIFSGIRWRYWAEFSRFSPGYLTLSRSISTRWTGPIIWKIMRNHRISFACDAVEFHSFISLETCF